MKFKARELIERAVEEGVAFGINCSYKYTDDPSPETIRDNVEREVMSAIEAVLDLAGEAHGDHISLS